MDLKVSRKERRIYNGAAAEVVIDNSVDLYPIYADDPRYAGINLPLSVDRSKLIMDAEILTDAQDQRLDRAMFAMMKQRGLDPTDLEDGVQWAEAMLGEIPSPVIVQQVQRAVADEGSGVQVTTSTVRNGTKENLVFEISLTN